MISPVGLLRSIRGTFQLTERFRIVLGRVKPAVLRLSNGGTVGGKSGYVLMPGNVTFQFDGTNLN
jgi:hypothetical protein